MRWIDNHCHLPHDDPEAAAAIIADAAEAGVERLINVATDVESSRAVIAMAAGRDDVWATVGVHPHDAKSVIDPDSGAVDLRAIIGLLDDPARDRIVAIGECGLDYHYDHSPRDQQRTVFAAQVRLAHERELALVIHTREAWDDTFAILASEGVPLRTVFHCFTGGPHEAERGLALGISLSFSGIVTYPSAPELRAAAAICPHDRVLVETDSPYLAPAPHRGKKNRPALVPVVGAAVADAMGESVASIAALTWANAAALYRLP